MAKIVGVKFNHSVKVYYFEPKNATFEKGDGVIVETVRGMEYGKISIPNKEVDDKSVVTPLKPIIRKATEADEAKVLKNEEKIPEAMRIAEEKIAEHKLNMKLVDCEYTFDGTKVIFYFSANGRVDFRELVRDLASSFHIRIELRQIGIRDETRILGGLGPCGRPCCCSCCMPDAKRVTIKMAKTQGLSLNPTKISGLCGRLMCCLEYENDYYTETFKQMPKIGSEITTPDGKGIVIANNMLKKEVHVKFENQKDGTMTYKDYPLDVLKISKRQKIDEVDESEKNNADIKELLDD